MSLADLLRPVDRVFRSYHIPYAVIGGYAVAAWGEERATRDVDLICGAADSKSVTDALTREQMVFERRVGDSDDPIAEVIRIEMDAAPDPFGIDVLVGIRDAPAGILDRVRSISLDSLNIPVVAPEDLIVLKLLGGSARDLEDARSVIQVQGRRLDLDLTRQLCPKHLKPVMEKLIGR